MTARCGFMLGFACCIAVVAATALVVGRNHKEMMAEGYGPGWADVYGPTERVTVPAPCPVWRANRKRGATCGHGWSRGGESRPVIISSQSEAAGCVRPGRFRGVLRPRMRGSSRKPGQPAASHPPSFYATLRWLPAVQRALEENSDDGQ